MASALTLTSLLDAGHVRLAQLGGALLLAQEADNEREASRLDLTIRHLRLSLEAAARLPQGRDQDVLLAYLCETYGLAEALVDPLLRAQLPPVPAVGATVQPIVLTINGTLLLINDTALVTGARLVAPPQ